MLQLGTEMFGLNASTQEVEASQSLEFKFMLFYLASSRPAGSTRRDPVSKSVRESLSLYIHVVHVCSLWV